jgi:hypothetical protein
MTKPPSKSSELNFLHSMRASLVFMLTYVPILVKWYCNECKETLKKSKSGGSK